MLRELLTQRTERLPGEAGFEPAAVTSRGRLNLGQGPGSLLSSFWTCHHAMGQSPCLRLACASPTGFQFRPATVFCPSCPHCKASAFRSVRCRWGGARPSVSLAGTTALPCELWRGAELLCAEQASCCLAQFVSQEAIKEATAAKLASAFD